MKHTFICVYVYTYTVINKFESSKES